MSIKIKLHIISMTSRDLKLICGPQGDQLKGLNKNIDTVHTKVYINKTNKKQQNKLKNKQTKTTKHSKPKQNKLLKNTRVK